MTNAELAILSLVVEQPRHGYDIKQVIEERGMRDWTEIGFSSIYHILKKLELAGLIESQVQSAKGRGPARKVYEVTKRGQATWREATLDILSQPTPQPQPLLQGLANLPGLSYGEAAQALANYQTQLKQRRQQVQSQWHKAGEVPFFVNAMFSYSLNLIDAELNWLAQFLGALNTAQRAPSPREGKPGPTPRR